VILAGDIAGYSRLMSSNEEGTLHNLKGHRKELVDPKITEHRGRIVKTTGDGIGASGNLFDGGVRNSRFGRPAATFKGSVHDCLIHQRAHEIAIVQPLGRGLHHQNRNELLLRIDPEVGAGDAAPREIADRAR
jgi:class 3 adenylate cyclase